MIIDEKQRQQQLKEWNTRNKHVLEVQDKAMLTMFNLVHRDGWPKADVLLFIELMMDTAKRMD
jgi:hypothetical protein